MNIEAVCFDIDGTLYPKYVTNIKLLSTLFPSIRLAHQYSKFRKAIRQEPLMSKNSSLPFKSMQALWITSGSIDGEFSLEASHMETELERQFYEKWKILFRHIQPYPQVREVILWMRSQNLKIGVLSDFPIESKLEALKIHDLVDFSCCSEDSGHLKPHKAPFVTMCTAMNVTPEHVLYVGDSYDKDIVGASNMGMYSCFLLPRYSLKRFLPRYPLATLICSDYSDLKTKLAAIL